VGAVLQNVQNNRRFGSIVKRGVIMSDLAWNWLALAVTVVLFAGLA
jgi:hypothetical protein